MDQRLIVVEGDVSLFRDVLLQLEREGVRLREGWTGSQVERGLGHSLFGPIRVRRDAEAALRAALDGHSLVAHVVRLEEAATFVDDLARIGRIEIRVGGASNHLSKDQIELLRLLGGGRTVADAGSRLHLSLRTTHRRLADARTALGARTTAEAVLIARSRGLC